MGVTPARGTDSACAARQRRPTRPRRQTRASRRGRALNPPVAATAMVRVTNKLYTDDLRALCGIELCAGVELHKDELHLSERQGDITLKANVASVCFKCFSYFRSMLQWLTLMLQRLSLMFHLFF
jgi:hypothetical protein